MLTREQIRWAMQHDWYSSAHHGTVTVKDYYQDDSCAEDEYCIQLITFDKWEDLLEFAGYWLGDVEGI